MRVCATFMSQSEGGKGEPIKELESVVDFVASSRKQIYEELDLIKSIVSEYESSQSGDHKRDDSSG